MINLKTANSGAKVSGKRKNMWVFNRSLVLLYSLKQNHLSIAWYKAELIYDYSNVCFFFALLYFCRINTRWLNTTEQWTSSVNRSGEMRNSLRHFLFRLKEFLKVTLGPFIRGKIRRVLHKTRTFRINGTFRLK